MGHLACSSANGLAPSQRPTYGEDKNHNAAVTSRDALSTQVGDDWVFSPECLLVCDRWSRRPGGNVCEPQMLRTDELAAELLLCLSPFVLPVLLVYISTVSSRPGRPGRALRPAGSPRRAPSARFPHPSPSPRLRGGAKQSWLFSRILCHLNKSVSLGETC